MQHRPDEKKQCNIGGSLFTSVNFFPGSVQGCFASQNVAAKQRLSKCQKRQQIGQIDSLAPFNPRDVTHIENDSLLWFARTGAFLKVAPYATR